MSIFYHDIVYKATKSDNEHQSALWFERNFSNTTFTAITTVKTQIESTKAHLKSNDEDINILLDLDLSILGQPDDIYKQYAEQIRKEYHIYPDFMYRKGRKKVLHHFLEQETIFKTAYFQDNLEHQAKINLKQELEQLR